MAQGFYGGYMGNAGALNDLVYRGEPTQMMPMPYYGGGMGIQQLAGGPSFDINPGGAGDARRNKTSQALRVIRCPIRTLPTDSNLVEKEPSMSVPQHLASWNAAVGNRSSFLNNQLYGPQIESNAQVPNKIS
jgi:hypothetical protein